MYVIGGIDLMEGSVGDVWVLDLKKLKKVMENDNSDMDNIWQLFPTTGESPGKVAYHRAIAIENIIYVYGGIVENENPEKSLFALDVRTRVWTRCLSKVCKNSTKF
jgi:hypothetical protein